MNKLQKVIEGLNCCAVSKLHDRCDKCPYFSSCNTEYGSFAKIAHDALKLLKSFESIESNLHLCDSCAKIYPECDATKDGVIFGTGVGNDNIVCCDGYVNCRREPANATIGGSANNCWWHACGNCHKPIDKGDKFCRHCGRAVKWE